MQHQFTEDNLKRHFPWVSTVRAGFVLVNDKKVLLVKERNGNIGPPKGLVDWSIDNTAFDGAMRELREETGFNLQNKNYKLHHNVYMYPRRHVRELMIYFVIFVNFRPKLYIKSEITEIIWAELSKGLSGKFKCSEASTVLYRAIDNSVLTNI
jgi:ADP-ribose pyrophosphatase YjhB (NUDIX family)